MSWRWRSARSSFTGLRLRRSARTLYVRVRCGFSGGAAAGHGGTRPGGYHGDDDDH